MLLPVLVPTWAVGRDTTAPRQGQPFALQACAVDAAPLPELLVELDAVAAPLDPWDGGSSARHPVRLHVGPLAVHYESASPLSGPVSVDLLDEWPYDHRLEPANPDGVELEFWEPDALVVDLQL